MEMWLLLIEIPIIVYLIYIIRKRIILLNERFDQIKREEADGAVDPYKALFDIMAPQIRGKISTTKSQIQSNDVTEHRNGSSGNPAKKEDHD